MILNNVFAYLKSPIYSDLYQLGRLPSHHGTNVFRLFSSHLLDRVKIESTEGFTSLPLSPSSTLKIGPFQIIGPYFGYDVRPLNQVWYQHQIIMAIKEDSQKNNINIDLPKGIIPNHEDINFLNFKYFSVNHDLAY